MTGGEPDIRVEKITRLAGVTVGTHHRPDCVSAGAGRSRSRARSLTRRCTEAVVVRRPAPRQRRASASPARRAAGHLPQALDALAQRQLDVAFGYLPGLPGPLAPDLAAAPITCTRLVALVRADRYSPDLPALSVADLRRGRLWFPGQGGSPELNAYAHEYAEQVHTTLSTDGMNLGLEVVVERLTAEPDAVTLVGSDWPVHDLPGLRVLPVHPVPLYPWYAAWRATNPHQDITTLITYLRRVGHRPRAGDDVWLPAAYGGLPKAGLGR